MTTRLSMPFLIRGRLSAKINTKGHDHPGGETALAALPDLDGMSMAVIHKLLDMKRRKCRTAHEGDRGDWVLSAYPEMHDFSIAP